MEETETQPVKPVVASGEKAKARDIIAAIRTLQAVEQGKRPATAASGRPWAASAASEPWLCRCFPTR